MEFLFGLEDTIPLQITVIAGITSIAIASVARGRTAREFLAAVILIPTPVTLLWMGVFGGGALEQSQNGVGQLADGLDNIALSVFFITSSDSGSLVIDSITSGGKLDAPVPQRIFWAAIEGLVASVLLYIGGKQALDALQAGTIAAGLPFTLILLFICVNLYKGLQHEQQVMATAASRN